jgi:hypothetical protein
MILFAREECRWADQFGNVRDLEVARVVMSPRGMVMRLGGSLLPLPTRLVGLPALLEGAVVTLGKAAIEERLRRPE